MSSPDRTVVQARHALPLHLTVQRPHIPWRQALWEKKLRELSKCFEMYSSSPMTVIFSSAETSTEKES